MPVQIVPFREEHIEDAAVLVCKRYKALRRGAPLLPSRYERVDEILPRLRELVAEGSGVVALRGRRLVGFLGAFVFSEFLGRRSVYSPEWGNAAEPGESRRIYEQMYAHLSAEWVADGCTQHLLTLLANDLQGLEGWFWLGFGLSGVDGLRSLDAVDGAAAQVQVRRAGLEDLELATAFSQSLGRHMTSAPVFWFYEAEDYAVWLGKETNALWLAYRDGEALGCMGIMEAYEEACTIIRDQGTASIVSAFTLEGARGGGVASALLNRSLEWARQQGYTRCAVDFEPMNVQAARFWTRWFQPVCYSLMRNIPLPVL
ncbi:MAG: GNAT family N-acetyltransferase [Anaerolineales bacterium]|nr:GNAT family N-acetyltransferase [Anaerolineales bacterium]